LYVGSDVSLNTNLYVNNDLSLNGNLYVGKRSLFTLDVSMNGNLDIGSGSNSVAINKDISSAFALDVSGVSQFRGNVDVAGTFTVNGAPVNAGGSLTGNVQVGSNSGFVTINKPQFYSDPSLTIYYDFDVSYTSVGGRRIYNYGNLGTAYDASINSTSGLIIDTTQKKNGLASLKNNPNAPSNNNGITICNNNTTNLFPVSSTMTFSMWIYKPDTPPPGTFDRIFEISDLITSNTSNSENNTIALDISSSGIVFPVLTSSNTSCFTPVTASNPIFNYNVCNGVWNNIVWQITSNRSILYINGTNTQFDTITTSVPTGSRKSAFIANSFNLTNNRDFSGNLDDFRYYKDKALTYSEIYQLSTNNFYTFDICGGFLANGPSVIYEPSGSKATANSGSLTLLHGDASGSSSIMFKSLNDPLEYGYIQYEENGSGSTGYHYGLMTIGIENDAGAGAYTAQADRISLFPSGGTGFVGVNTKMPLYSLDVSGILNTNADVSINGVRVGKGTGNKPENLAVGVNALLSGTDLNNGWCNTAIGYSTLTAVALQNNTAVGAYALQNNTGSQSTAVGASALITNTTGVQNTAVGALALQANNTGNYNVAIGTEAFKANTSGSSNTAVGTYALISTNGKTKNTALGHAAGNATSNQSTNVGDNNTFIGADTYQLGTGSNNTFLGYGAYANSSGNWGNSTAIGTGAVITASNQIKLGRNTESVFCGNNLLLQAPSDNHCYIRNTTANNLYFGTETYNYMWISSSGLTVQKSTGTLLTLQNTSSGASLNQTNIDFYTGTFLMGRIAVNNRATSTWSSSMSFFVAIHTDQLYEAIRITGVAQDVSNCCDVKIYGDVEAVSYNAVSDYRVKENVVPLDASFTVDGLNPVTYNLKSSGKQDIGFIAHEVQEFYPFLVNGEKDGKDTQSLNYNGFIGILTKEVKDLKKKVAEQERKALEQDARIQALEKMMLDLINK
jgi:hypothetical protein